MSSPAAQILDYSKHQLLRGNIGFADAAARACLGIARDHAEAWAQLALIARMVKEDQTAARFARVALQSDPKHPQAKSALAATSSAPPSLDERSSPDDRYLLIRSWNAGFWSDVDHVLGCLLLASLTNRTPIIHWGPDSRYGGTAEASAWNLYFHPMSRRTVHDIADEKLPCFPPKWNYTNLSGPSINRFTGAHSRTCWLTLLNRPEPIVVADYFTPLSGVCFYLRPEHPQFGRNPDAIYRELIASSVRPLATHVAAASHFAQEHFINRPVLAVHIRATDKAEEDPASTQSNQHIFAYAQQIFASGHARSIFLLTDSASAQSQWRNHFGDALITSSAAVGDGVAGLHFQEGFNPASLGVDILRDSLIATHADAIAGLASSNVPRMIRYLKSWTNGTVQLVGPDILSMPNFTLFDPRVSFGDRN